MAGAFKTGRGGAFVRPDTYPVPLFASPDAFQDNIFATPPNEAAAKGLGFDQMGSPEQLNDWLQPRLLERYRGLGAPSNGNGMKLSWPR